MKSEHPFIICVVIATLITHRHSTAMHVDKTGLELTKIANYSGDVMLGAFFPIHEAGSNFTNCGRIQLEDGIQPLEALLYTIKTINAKGIIPGVRLGVIALDSCDNVVHALDQSLDFIRGFVSRLNERDKINDNDNEQRTCNDAEHKQPETTQVVGVIGAQSSQVSVQIANLLRIFRVPQISYMSTSSTLSNRQMFEYFFRTVPSDINQVVTILKILQYFNWTYASLVYSNTDYGNKGLEELEKLAPSYKVCFSSPQRINVNQFKEQDYDNIIDNLMINSRAKVVIMFADKRSARQLMSAVKRQNAIGRFVWIGSDGWSGRHTVADGQEEVLEGAITVQPLWGHLSGFDEYFTERRPNRTVSEVEMNPWFNEFWEEYFMCRLKDSERTPYNEHYSTCSTNLSISAAEGYKQQTYLHFVRDAAYAFAYAIRNLHSDLCHGVPGVCKKMKAFLLENDLKSYLENVTFNDELGRRFRFQKNGEGPPRYSILNYQKLSSGTYAWMAVGSYLSETEDSQLPAINRSTMRFPGGNEFYPLSYCSEPCLEGQAKIQQEGESCCWVCANCSTYQYLTSFQICNECPLGTLPNAAKTSCVAIDVRHIDYDNPWAITSMVVAGIGLLITIAISLVFRIYSDTPIIKAAGRELSYVLLCGIFLSYAMTFVLVSKPSAVVCGIKRFFLGLCYTMCYAAIVTKTNRIARIFKAKYNVKQKTRFISPRSQVIITSCLISIEVFINGLWLLVQPPKTVNVFPTREENILICADESANAAQMVGLVYPFVLIGFCTVYAFKTRKCPEGFNETRFVAFTNYTTCVLWLSFLPLYFSSGNVVKRTVTLSFSLSMAATVQLGCLFVPKIYMVLFKPEKNTKEVVMSQPKHHQYHHRCQVITDIPTSLYVDCSLPPKSPSYYSTSINGGILIGVDANSSCSNEFDSSVGLGHDLVDDIKNTNVKNTDLNDKNIISSKILDPT